MIALIVVGSILAYCAIATCVGVKSYWHILDHSKNGYGDEPFTATIMGAFWPLCIWMLIGMTIIAAGEQRRRRQAEMSAERDYLLAQARTELEPFVGPNPLKPRPR